MPLPNLVVSDVSWFRICPRAIGLQFVVSRSDGDYLTNFPWSAPIGTQRPVEVNWMISGFSPKGPFNIDRNNVFGFRRLLVQATLDNMPPGDYAINVTQDVVDPTSSEHYGDCGVAGASADFTITNAIPTLAQNAAVTYISPSGVMTSVNGQIGETCPNYCTTVVNGTVVGVDDNMLESTSVYQIGSQTSTGGYQQAWFLDANILNMPPIGGITTGVLVKWTGVTTNVWGQQSWPAVCSLYFARPANKRWGDTGEGGGGHGGGGNG